MLAGGTKPTAEASVYTVFSFIPLLHCKCCEHTKRHTKLHELTFNDGTFKHFTSKPHFYKFDA